MNRALSHVRTYIFRGLLAIIPLVMTFFVVRLLYVGIDQRIRGWIDHLIGISIPGLGILLVLLLLYLLGVVASNVIGRQVFNWIERMTRRIPLINSTYQIGKQLTSTLALPEKQVFKRAVLVEFLKPGSWTIGFVTGTLIDRSADGAKLLKVYVPTPPNPTSGFIIIIKESEVRDPGWTIEETLKAIISAGIIGPVEIK